MNQNEKVDLDLELLEHYERSVKRTPQGGRPRYSLFGREQIRDGLKAMGVHMTLERWRFIKLGRERVTRQELRVIERFFGVAQGAFLSKKSINT